MPLGLGTAAWAAVIPKATTNLCINPSYEFGTASVVAVESAGLGSSSAQQQFGAWSLFVTPTSNGTSGAQVGTWTAANLTDYSVSAHAKLVNGVSYIFGASDTNGGNYDLIGTVNVTGGGTWHRYTMSYRETVGGGARGIILAKRTGANTGTYWVDGIQAELGSVTTYIDGDQPGGTWTGPQHASTSMRTGQYRGGGSVIALADLGLSVNDMPGVGMPPIENSAQSYAVLDGAQYQRSRAGARSFTLTGKPIMGTTTQDYHITRRTLIDAFKIDSVTPQQPTRFLYVGGQGTMQIDAVYDSGLELGNMTGPMAEDIAIKFVAYNPYWSAPTQQGTTLVPRLALGSTNYIAYRDPAGKWGTMGPAGASVNNVVNTILPTPSGTVFVGGNFTSAGGTASAKSIAQFVGGGWGTLGGGTVVTGGVFALLRTPSGTLYVGGNIAGVSGTATVKGIAQHANGAWGTLTGGTLATGGVFALALAPYGTLYVGGGFTGIAGTASQYMAQYNGAWGSLVGGTLNVAGASALAISAAGSIYAGGGFTSVAGTSANYMARWSPAGSWGTLGGGTLDNTITALAFGPDQTLYIGGLFQTLAGGTVGFVVSYNGVAMSALGNGLRLLPDNSAGHVNSLTVGSAGQVYIGGYVSQAGGLNVTEGLVVWDRSSWRPPDIDVNGATPVFYALAFDGQGTLYAGGDFAGTASAATTVNVVNTGRALAYPTLRLRNNASINTKVYQIVNTTTGAAIYFNFSLLPSEVATLTLEPGNRSFTSTFQQNVFSAIVPGSNLSSFNLESGTNTISFFSDNDSLEASLFWTPRSWSADSGTTY